MSNTSNTASLENRPFIFNLESLSEEDLIFWQLRIIFTKASHKDLERLYFVWKFPETYKEVWVEKGFAANVPAANDLEARLQEKNLIVVLDQIGRRKLKGLHPQISKLLKSNDTTIILNLKSV